jgi:hypothetical protein
MATPPRQALWVLNGGSGPNISVFQPAQLKKNGTVGSIGLSTGSFNTNALTFDKSHNLWLGLCANYPDAVVELTTAALRHLVTYGTARFSTIIQDPVATPHHGAEYLDCPQALQFDPSGNLWVESPITYNPLYGTSLLEYTSGELRSSGKLVPAAVIETPTAGRYGPQPMAFDHAGNLWLVSGGIVEYTAAQRAAGAQTDPNQTLIVGDPTLPKLDFAQSITFDAGGNLWAAFGTGGTRNAGGLEMFAAADLNGSGTVTPTPVTTIEAVVYGTHGTLSSFGGPDGLAFDSQGDLWVANSTQPIAGLGSGYLVEFTPSELSTSGSPVPVRSILANRDDTNLGRPSFMTFGTALP